MKIREEGDRRMAIIPISKDHSINIAHASPKPPWPNRIVEPVASLIYAAEIFTGCEKS
jgi:hypothetical protein